MKNYVNRSVQLNEAEEATLSRAVKRSVKSIFERESSPTKRRILLDTIPFVVYSQVIFDTVLQESMLFEKEEERKFKKKRKKVRKSSSKR